MVSFILFILQCPFLTPSVGRVSSFHRRNGKHKMKHSCFHAKSKTNSDLLSTIQYKRSCASASLRFLRFVGTTNVVPYRARFRSSRWRLYHFVLLFSLLEKATSRGDSYDGMRRTLSQTQEGQDGPRSKERGCSNTLAWRCCEVLRPAQLAFAKEWIKCRHDGPQRNGGEGVFRLPGKG
jgi:hypothetical protein